jgi:hypothetical protein
VSANRQHTTQSGPFHSALLCDTTTTTTTITTTATTATTVEQGNDKKLRDEEHYSTQSLRSVVHMVK